MLKITCNDLFLGMRLEWKIKKIITLFWLVISSTVDAASIKSLVDAAYVIISLVDAACVTVSLVEASDDC